MAPPGAPRRRLAAVSAILLLLSSGAPATGAALGSVSNPEELSLHDTALEASLSGPDLWGEGSPEAWFQWTRQVPLETLVYTARARAPDTGVVPAPDALPDYDVLPEPDQREAWRAWWIATAIVAARLPTHPTEPPGSNGEGANEDNEKEPRTGIGNPRGLDTLWRMEAHGAPRQLISTGEGGAMFLLTDLGVVHLPGPDDDPDWILRLEDTPVRGEATQGDDGSMLVVGTPAMFGRSSPTIHVVDDTKQEIVYQGRSGEEAFLYWRLTDVDGDGQKDILGVDLSRNLTALQLDGTEIYRRPLPTPDLPTAPGLPEEPEPILPGYLALALQRTGSPVFGDATGDGVLDLYMMHEYWMNTEGLLDPSLIVVSAVSGTSGEIAWSRIVEPAERGRFLLPAAAGDLDGDASDDLVLTERRIPSLAFMSSSLTNLVVSGATGIPLARDDPQSVCVMECIPLDDPYEPLAVIDRTGNGDGVIVGLKRDPQRVWAPPQALVVRALQEVPVPGSPTRLVEEHELDLDSAGFPYGHAIVRERSDGAGIVILFENAGRQDDARDTGTIHRLDGDSYEQITPGEPVGHYDVHAGTGQTYAWTLRDDRWVRVGETDLTRQGNGTRLLRSVEPHLIVDRGGGHGTQLLLERSLGYHWVSGTQGTIAASAERPAHSRARIALEHGGTAHVLESHGRDLVLYDLEHEREVWRADKLLEEAALRGAGDFTGDGNVEVLLQTFARFGGDGGRDGGLPGIIPGIWEVRSPRDGRTVWEQEGEGVRAVGMDAIPGEPGLELVVLESSDSETTVSLWRAGEDEERWSRTYTSADVVNTQGGDLLVAAEDAEGRFFDVLDGASGDIYHEVRPEAAQEVVWGRLMPLDSNEPYLVYSYGQEREELPGTYQQRLVVVDPLSGDPLVEHTLSDPDVEILRFSGGETRTVIDYAEPGPLLGDWDGGGWQDLALQEDGRGVVRSLRDGELLSVSPRQGAYVSAHDITGDGRKEVALLSHDQGSLRLYAFDPSQVDLEREDPLARLDTDADNETDDDVDDRRSPGPGGLPLVVLLVLAGAWARSRLDRGRSRRTG